MYMVTRLVNVAKLCMSNRTFQYGIALMSVCLSNK